MYAREFGYRIVPGQEEKAVALCQSFVATLRERGLRAHVVAGNALDATLHVVEEYYSLSCMEATHAALQCDENYRSDACAWAAEFYPLVQSALPAVVTREQLAA